MKIQLTKPLEWGRERERDNVWPLIKLVSQRQKKNNGIVAILVGYKLSIGETANESPLPGRSSARRLPPVITSSSTVSSSSSTLLSGINVPFGTGLAWLAGKKMWR